MEEDREENKEGTDTEMRVGRVKVSGRERGGRRQERGGREKQREKKKVSLRIEGVIQKVETKKEGRRREKWRNGWEEEGDDEVVEMNEDKKQNLLSTPVCVCVCTSPVIKRVQI